jgi:hypothetical protein
MGSPTSAEMINLTERILIVVKDQLDSNVRESLSAVLEHLQSRYGQTFPGRLQQGAQRVSGTLKLTHTPTHHAFAFLFSHSLTRVGKPFDETFLHAAFDFTSLNSRNLGAGPILDILAPYTSGLRPSGPQLQSIKQGLKLLLVDLRERGAIALPTVFAAGTYFRPLSADELHTFVTSYEASKQGSVNRVSEIMSPDARRIYYYMPRILWATSWHKAEDVAIEELAALHRAQRLFIAGVGSERITTSPVPWLLFLNELLKSFPDTVTYTIDHLKSYSRWMHSHQLNLSLPDFVDSGQRATKPRACSRQLSTESLWRGEQRKIQPERTALKPDRCSELTALSKSQEHAAALQYFKQFGGRPRNGFDWLDKTSIYIGREHVAYSDKAQLWKKTFQAFIYHREKVQRYESNKVAISALNILADYIFLYLPWWQELYPEAGLKLPLAPIDFTRYVFMHRNMDEPLSSFPSTFPEVLALRRATPHTQYGALKQIQLFFAFVEAHFSDDEEIAGSTFRSPISEEFDMPRISRRGKTSKVVFPKNSYGYLVYFGYAVEAFGQYLQERIQAGSLSEQQVLNIARCRFIVPEDLGFVPFVRFRGTITPITLIPNVFTWVRRYFRGFTTVHDPVLVPHLTTMRLLLTAIEIGLRLAGLLWLDRRTWDQGNAGSPTICEFSYQPVDSYVYTLHVNTDKSKNGPWDTLIVYRVRALLQREQNFQLSIEEAGMDDDVQYMKRPQSRFSNVVPLFRSHSSPHPISSTQYSAHWVRLLIGFQAFYQSVSSTDAQFIKICPRQTTGKADKTDPSDIRDENGAWYCPISILAISTPHACRASFATNRQGILETSDIAELVGHDDPLVTAYYQSPRAEDLKQRLEQSDRQITSGSEVAGNSSMVNLRADLEESSLVKNFKANRQKTIEDFGFMPPTLWSLPDLDRLEDESLTALRSGPMSSVRFRETHICPVGEECPTQVVQATGGFKRCGLCPLAMKCVDHLPAIAAKKHALIERIRFLTRQKEWLSAVGTTATAEAIWEELELETNELLGWQLSEEILVKIYKEQMSCNQDDVTFHAARSDIVRAHLERWVKKTDQTEFLLHRLIESDAYPCMQSPEVQAVAANLRRRLMAGRDVPDLLSIPGPEDIEIASKFLKTVMRASHLSITDISRELDRTEISLPSASPLRIGQSE